MNEAPESDGKIDSTFRNGSLTAIGIILGFSLSFLARWASNPNDWSRIDIVPLVPLIVGIGLQTKSFSDLLTRESLLIPSYDRARRLFIIGLLAFGLGVAIAIAIDIFGLGRQKLLG